MIFAKKKILVWCDDPPEDPVISIFAGCLANHDRAHSRRLDGISEFLIEWGSLRKCIVDIITLTLKPLIDRFDIPPIPQTRLIV